MDNQKLCSCAMIIILYMDMITVGSKGYQKGESEKKECVCECLLKKRSKEKGGGPDPLMKHKNNSKSIVTYILSFGPDE